MSGDIDEARAAIARLAFFVSAGRGEVEIARLGGLTNLVFRVDCAGRSYVLRLPGRGTEDYIDRSVEAVAARAAARAGVSPEVIHADPASGIMLTEFVEGAVTMTPRLFRDVRGAPGRAGLAFRKLHRSGETFNFRFELFRMIDDYLKVLSGKDVAFPAGYHDVLKEAETVRRALDQRPLPLVPCHCDPLCENFLDTGSRMWIVDWEYSGMNDPMWDLGDLSVEGGFDADQDEEMILSYFGGAPSSAERGRIVIYKAMCDLLWTLWGLIQHANKNPADDFWAYATNRFERCKRLMADRQFAGHVEAVRRG
ncbi:MAG: choline/ethanolamine kinase family protein [Hyphomicrobiaceae bacterium]